MVNQFEQKPLTSDSLTIQGHRINEKKSIAMHQVIGQKLKSNPLLLKKVESCLNKWIIKKSIHNYYAQKWKQILSFPIEKIIQRIIQDNEEMCDLRQSSPFTGSGLLTPQERWKLLKEWRDVI